MGDRKLLLLFNPSAHSGRSARLRQQIESSIRQQGLDLEILVGTKPRESIPMLADMDLSPFTAVVAAGGDGTLFEVLNGLMKHPREKRPALAVLPIGTGNAFSQDLGLESGNWQAAVTRLVAGTIRTVDVGCIRCAEGVIYFLNIAGMGLVVDAGLTALKLKRLGNISYSLGALWQVLRLSTQHLCIEVDGIRVEQQNVFAEISNSRYTGTSFLMAPQARLDDGLLDLTLLRKLSRFRLLRLFPTIYSGRHVDHPEITVMQGSHFRLIEPAGCPLMMDGEFFGTTPADITCLPGALRVLA